MPRTDLKVMAYYFPNWHVDPRNEKWHGEGWTEWNLVKYATPRFPGHKQPKIPLWGYEDEAQPGIMEKKIDTAAKYGIDGFIFDWYFYADGPYRNRCLEQGLLKSANLDKIKFAVMWCNHDAIQAHPGSRMFPKSVLCSGNVDSRTFREATQYCIDHYFTSQSYLRIDGKLYFSIFSLMKMVNELGGIDASRALFDDFRDRVQKAGLGELHLNAVNFERMKVPSENLAEEVNKLSLSLGLDSFSRHSWSWKAPDFPTIDYEMVADENMREYEYYCRNFNLPYNASVLVGWDSSPRTVQSEIYGKVGYPFTAVFSNATPVQFEKILRKLKAICDSDYYKGNLVLLHSWNEWTEGTYLEPDNENGFGYLEAVKKVFK